MENLRHRIIQITVQKADKKIYKETLSFARIPVRKLQIQFSNQIQFEISQKIKHEYPI